VAKQKFPKSARHVATRLVFSPEDWFPSFPDGMVSGSVIRMHQSGPRCLRICFWGDDDFGMELNLDVPADTDLQLEVQRWTEWLERLKQITQADLKKLGFIRA